MDESLPREATHTCTYALYGSQRVRKPYLIASELDTLWMRCTFSVRRRRRRNGEWVDLLIYMRKETIDDRNIRVYRPLRSWQFYLLRWQPRFSLSFFFKCYMYYSNKKKNGELLFTICWAAIWAMTENNLVDAPTDAWRWNYSVEQSPRTPHSSSSLDENVHMRPNGETKLNPIYRKRTWQRRNSDEKILTAMNRKDFKHKKRKRGPRFFF